MDVIYAGQPIPPEPRSIFLAGPTPRSREVKSWRPDAVGILRDLGFTGSVLVPERPDGWARVDYLDQVEWEFAGLEVCAVIVFWVPRDLSTLPGFTTNVEFGRYVDSGRCVYGRPDGAPHTKYLDWLYTKLTGKQPAADLTTTLGSALKMMG